METNVIFCIILYPFNRMLIVYLSVCNHINSIYGIISYILKSKIVILSKYFEIKFIISINMTFPAPLIKKPEEGGKR